jgi:hypothetical protein
MTTPQRKTIRRLALVGATLFVPLSAMALPPITGTPVIDSPPLLAWPADRGETDPSLIDNTANTLHDLHGSLDACDLVLSSEGNYHPALHDIWPVFLAKFKEHPLKNWLYTTSPPVAVPQLANKQLRFGNYYINCMPSVAVASKSVMDKLVAAGSNDGPPAPLYQDRGDVILVKFGNPKHIRSVWDLGRSDVRVITPHPTLEKGAFDNYAETLYGIASKDPHPPKDMTADRLFAQVYNGATGVPDKWLAGERIHHRDLPWSIVYGRADAAVILTHLARYMKATFPDKFDIVPLGGSVEDPQPLPGTKTNVRYVVKIKGEWTARQIEARDKLVDTLLSQEFTEVLERRGLARPEGFRPGR